MGLDAGPRAPGLRPAGPGPGRPGPRAPCPGRARPAHILSYRASTTNSELFGPPSPPWSSPKPTRNAGGPNCQPQAPVSGPPAPAQPGPGAHAGSTTGVAGPGLWGSRTGRPHSPARRRVAPPPAQALRSNCRRRGGIGPHPVPRGPGPKPRAPAPQPRPPSPGPGPKPRARPRALCRPGPPGPGPGPRPRPAPGPRPRPGRRRQRLQAAPFSRLGPEVLLLQNGPQSRHARR